MVEVEADLLGVEGLRGVDVGDGDGNDFDPPVADRHAAVAAEAGPEGAVPDIRDTAIPDSAEHADPAQRHQVPTAEDTAAAVTRAQTALAELTARRRADAAREAEHIAPDWDDRAARGVEHEAAATGRGSGQPDALGTD